MDACFVAERSERSVSLGFRARLSRTWILWRRTPRQSLGASRPVIDLIVIFVLPPGIIAWGIADVLGAEGRSLVDRLFGVFSSSSAGCCCLACRGATCRDLCKRTSDRS